LTRLSHEIDQAVASPGLRYDSSLLDLAPAETVIFIGVPNVSQSLNQAYAMLEEKIDSNDILRDWWQESVGTESQDELRQAMEMIRDWGEQLGEEIAVTMQKPGRDVEDPLVLARLTHPATFPGFVEAEMGRLAAEHGEIPAFQVFEGDLALATADPADRDGDVFFWVQGDLVAISFKLDQLYALAAERQTGSRDFAGGAFHSRLADVYREGAQWVVGVDVGTLSAESGQGCGGEMLEEMGLLDLQHVIGERKERGDRTENRVVLTFDQPRKGLASWLAEPAAMGSMDFISPDASLAAGFVMREPASVVDELFGILGSDDAEFEQQLDEFQNEHGIDIRKDIAAALGGEFAFALDGPVLPNPSWKLVMEVYDPDQLQRSLEWAVGEINRQAEGSEFQGLTLGSSKHGGRDFFELRSTDTGLAAHYTFVDGYMVAGASRALVDRALRIRDSGINLTNAPGFISRLPADGELNFSGAFYQNLGPILGSLSRHIGDAAGRLSPDHQQMIEQIGTMNEPTLTLAYGEPSRIIFVHSDEGGLFGSSLGAMLRLESLMSVQELLEQAGREGSGDRNPADDTEVDVRVKTHINQG